MPARARARTTRTAARTEVCPSRSSHAGPARRTSTLRGRVGHRYPVVLAARVDVVDAEVAEAVGLREERLAHELPPVLVAVLRHRVRRQRGLCGTSAFPGGQVALVPAPDDGALGARRPGCP